MEYQSVCGIYFSPTGTTKSIVENIVNGIGDQDVRMIDITQRTDRKNDLPELNQALVILAVPVYYGRIPEEVAPFIAELKVKNTPVIPVVVYGNREYDDALKELYDLSVAGGFSPIAAAAFIGEHSYSIAGRHIAHGRPDPNDIQKARDFGKKIKDKIQGLKSLDGLEPLMVPGNVPYIEPSNLNMIKMARKMDTVSLTPQTDKDLCVQCLQCVEACPNGAIDDQDISKIDKLQCMICFACVKICPEKAKQMTDSNFNIAIEQLKIACEQRKEPEIFV
ncbi:MAG: 4Fe-4S dicluster domain-containing protein [Desulfobacteraceae bacterium]|nr:4Fe-4S dicluster domain-containing protein [Desulfobacteraceae bacterium]